MRLKRACSIVIVLLSAAAWGQARGGKNPVSDGTAGSNTGTVPALQERNPRYEIRAGDSFDVAFTFSPEFNQSITVQPDGYITLRDAGDVHVAGMTVPQVRDAIAKAYSRFLNNPEITVQLKDFEKPYFIATGQVGKPGKYELRGSTRVTEAIAIAGGFNDASKHSQVVLYRHVSPDLLQATVIDVKKMLANNDLGEDPIVSPGDLIYVPQNTMSKFRRYIPAPGVGVSVTPVP